MKKLLCIIALAFLAIGANAQDPNFYSENDGYTVVQGSIFGSGDEGDLFREARKWATLLATDGELEIDDEKKTIETKGVIQSKGAYNPFAGVFNDYFHYTLEVDVKDGAINYVFKNLKLTKTYSGYGSTSTTYLIEDLLDIVFKSDELIADVEANPTLSKKDKKKKIKDLKGDAEGFGVALKKVEDTIKDHVNSLKSRI